MAASRRPRAMMLERVEWSESAAPVGICCRPASGLGLAFIVHGHFYLAWACLFSMGADLAVDELKAALCVCDLLAEVGGEFGEEIAVFAGGGFGVEVQLGRVRSQAACAARHRGWRCRARRAGSGA